MNLFLFTDFSQTVVDDGFLLAFYHQIHPEPELL